MRQRDQPARLFNGEKDEAAGVSLRAVAEEVAGLGVCILADALHTNRPTAQHLLDLGLDFVLAVKDSQPTVLEEVRDSFHWNCMPTRSAG